MCITVQSKNGSQYYKSITFIIEPGIKLRFNLDRGGFQLLKQAFWLSAMVKATLETIDTVQLAVVAMTHGHWWKGLNILPLYFYSVLT